jgi:hypothetical protein
VKNLLHKTYEHHDSKGQLLDGADGGHTHTANGVDPSGELSPSFCDYI